MFTPEEIAASKAAILERLVGGESVRSICAADGMPAASTVFKWLIEDSAFSEQYARAREAQADALFDEILDIADDGSNDWMERKNADGQNIGWQENGEALRRSQLRVEARKWMAGKLKPKKYGDKVFQEVTGKDGVPLLPETDPQKLARAAAVILARGVKNKQQRRARD